MEILKRISSSTGEPILHWAKESPLHQREDSRTKQVSMCSRELSMMGGHPRTTGRGFKVSGLSHTPCWAKTHDLIYSDKLV